MLPLLTIALAVFTIIVALQAVLPFALPARAAPYVVAALAYGVTKVPAHYHTYVQAAACAGLVAVIHKFAVSAAPEPWSLRHAFGWVHLPKRRRKSGPVASPVGHRIPRL